MSPVLMSPTPIDTCQRPIAICWPFPLVWLVDDYVASILSKLFRLL